MKSHHDLKVWRASILLAKAVYELTQNFPREALYGLTSQMRRAAVSVASNIAEGAARQGTREFNQYLYIAVGSVNELDTHVEIGKEIRPTTPEAATSLQQDITEVLKMLRGLLRSLKTPR